MNSVSKTLLRRCCSSMPMAAVEKSKIFYTRLPPLPTLRDLVKMYKLRAIKQLSQNFLLDEKITSKIVKAAAPSMQNKYVVEVGPGPGGITRSILSRGASEVVLIEKDKRFESMLRMLEEAVAPRPVKIYWGDVLSFDMSKMFPEDIRHDWNDISPPIHVIGNLPFSVSTPLITRWLHAISERRNVWAYGRVPLTLTFQLEVGERLVAPALGEQRSRLSIMSQHLCHTSHKFTIPGSAFVPKPDVDVAVIKFIPRKVPLIKQPFPLVEKVVRHTFSMRQKFCRRGISTLFPESVRDRLTVLLLQMAEIHPETRPYELTMEDFSSLCDAYAKICEKHPSLRGYNYRGIRPDEIWEEENNNEEYEAYRAIPNVVKNEDILRKKQP